MRQSGRLRVKLGRVEEGVRELEEALALSLPLKALSLEAYAYRELARAYEVQGNFVAAYEAQRKLIATNETVFNDRSRQQLAILNSRYIEERREMEIDLLRREQALKDAELARSRAERGWLLAVAGVGVVALAAMVSRQRIKLRAEQRVVAETRAAKEAAERADQLKTRLLSIASHDLKNPVATVMGGLLELRESAPEEKEFIDGLLVESERMLALIRDLLDLAALENGQLRLSPAALDLVPLVGDVVTTQQPRARVKQIELRLDPASVGAARVQGDANRLRQVLVNLVDNALKFTPPGGAVTVALKQAGGQIEVSITDTGPGMTPEDMANLFTPFASLSAKPTGGEKSTGLGLSICHELVAMHRGRLEVRSVPGAGATFAVVLPADGATQV
jgi:signal transduction histidine kinase